MLLRTLLALLLTVAPASAQFVFSGGGSGGSGTVTTLSVATANGFAGTVATATTTPVITLTTSVTGNVCSNATALSACSTTGTGATVLASTPTLVTPVLGVASGTSLALGGATIGTNALAVTGTANISGVTTVGAGTAATPGLTVGAAGYGIYQVANQVGISAVGVVKTGFNIPGAASGTWSFVAGMPVLFDGAGRTASIQTGATPIFALGSTGQFAWTSTSDSYNGTIDTNLSRNAAGISQFGTNASNAAGSWLATNGTLSGVLNAAAGSTGTPSINFSDANTGFYRKSNQKIAVSLGGADAVLFENATSGLVFANGFGIGFGDSSFGTINANISRSTAGVVQFGTTTANALGSWLAVNGTLSGASLITGTADATTTTSGALQVAGGAAIRKRVFMDGLTASAGLQTAVICQSSAGELIADSVACLASSERFKTIIGAAETGALDKITRLTIQRWNYNKEGIFNSSDWTRERIGPIAEQAAKIDPRLVGYDNEGRVRNISTEQLLSLTIQAVQELKADNDNLRATLTKRAANGG